MLGNHSSLALTLAGVAFFIYGMALASENLQRLAASRIRDIITTLSRKPVWGVFLGVALTMILQSSGAVISMLVGLGSAGIITLPQVMSVILGAAIGSTLTVQVLSFNISQFGLPIFGLSFFVYFLSKRKTLKSAMAALMGFGLIFWGLELTRIGTEALSQTENFTGLLKTLSENPLYAILVTAFFTALVQSSAMTISLAMTLTAHGTMSVHDSVYWIFGANIGTTAVALIAASGGNYVGRQVAWAHCFYKVIGVLIFVPIVPFLVEYLSWGLPERDVANINTIYNIFAAALFFPFISKGAALVEKFFPPSENETQFSVRYLKKADWESPSVFLAHAEREALRMADIVTSMIEDSLKMFRRDDEELVAQMRKRDDHADILARELNLALAQQLDQAPPAQQQQMLKLMNFVTDMEAAADVVDNQLLELAQKKHHLRVEFSEAGWKDLESLASAVAQIASMSIACFQTQDKDLAAKVIFHKRNIRRLEQRMRESHIARLTKGNAESINTSGIHLDVLGEYRRIVGLMSNHVYSLLKDSDPYGLLPRRE